MASSGRFGDFEGTSEEYVTSLPAWRETHRAEKNDRYFNFKYLRLCVHIDISHNII